MMNNKSTMTRLATREDYEVRHHQNQLTQDQNAGRGWSHLHGSTVYKPQVTTRRNSKFSDHPLFTKPKKFISNP